jgi:hypothetical protein
MPLNKHQYQTERKYRMTMKKELAAMKNDLTAISKKLDNLQTG